MPKSCRPWAARTKHVLGSFFAGIKAGTVSGVLYLGGLAVLNVVVLYVFKADTLNALSHSYSQYCTSSPTNSTVSGTPEDCFASVVTVLIPIGAFVGFLFILVLAGLFGRYYDSFPGKGPLVRGETMAIVSGLGLQFFGLAGDFFTYAEAAAVSLIFLGLTATYGLFLGRLYRRYTRLVHFESEDASLLKVLVGGKDMTGKTRTLAHTSSHNVRAEVADDAYFKGWQVDGAISVEDSRSFETTLEVSGDGGLKGGVGKKY